MTKQKPRTKKEGVLRRCLKCDTVFRKFSSDSVQPICPACRAVMRVDEDIYQKNKVPPAPSPAIERWKWDAQRLGYLISYFSNLGMRPGSFLTGSIHSEQVKLLEEMQELLQSYLARIKGQCVTPLAAIGLQDYDVQDCDTHLKGS